jgi:hypothetical protein
MKNASTGKITPDNAGNQTDWTRVRAMTDTDIRHDEDSPATAAADWEGAALKLDGVVVGRAHVRRRKS